MTLAVSVAGLSKRYTLHHVARPSYESLREVLTEGARSALRRLRSGSGAPPEQDFDEEFWALRDVGFEVRQGERFGIIGRNGAGKSTLLKLLSRITEPTNGRIEIRGRVSSLLEVGTGFHPELTGRENIHLNGTILGMSSREMRLKFDEIVAFAEIERFLDTPVKRYSSGMYVRLAFAVAAHLEPEILIVDEVLAVGDARFQDKCLQKMESVSREEGRTLLVVSHNMGLMRQLCARSMLLRQGRVEAIGPTGEVVSVYLGGTTERAAGEYRWSEADSPTDEVACLHGIRICSELGETCTEFLADEPVIVEVRYRIFRDVPDLRIGIALHTADGGYLFYSADCDSLDTPAKRAAAGQYLSRCRIPADLLNTGTFYIAVSGELHGVRTVFGGGLPRLRFTVFPARRGADRFKDSRKGPFCPRLHWDVIEPGS
jgi:lipopolysaccharide transport system ATP-binding protein